MTVEANTGLIKDFQPQYPRDGDLIKEGAAHIRNIKDIVQKTFKGITGVVNMTHTKINLLDTLLNPSVPSTGNGTLTVNGSINGKTGANWDLKGAQLKGVNDPTDSLDAVNKAYLEAKSSLLAWPIGSIYMARNATSPESLFGGKWTQIGQGCVLVGVGGHTDIENNHLDFNLQTTGGAYRHRLQTSEMPRHQHPATLTGSAAANGEHNHDMHLVQQDDGDWHHIGHGSQKVGMVQPRTSTDGRHDHSVTVSGNTGPIGGNSSNGQTESHENMVPFITAYFWTRTA